MLLKKKSLSSDHQRLFISARFYKILQNAGGGEREQLQERQRAAAREVRQDGGRSGEVPERDRVAAERAVQLQDGTRANMQGARGNRAEPPTASQLFVVEGMGV